MTRVQRTEYRVQLPDFRVQRTEYRVQLPVTRVQRTEYKVQLPDFRVQRTEYKVQLPCGIFNPNGALPLFIGGNGGFSKEY